MSNVDCDFGAEILGPEEHMRCMKEQRESEDKKRLIEWARRNVVMTYVEDHAKTLIQNVLADLVEDDMKRHPKSTMEESVMRCTSAMRAHFKASVTRTQLKFKG